MVQLPAEQLRDPDPLSHETHTVYEFKSAEAQTVFRNRFEDIFAKYENMAEDEGDIVDMRTQEVRKDNGHLRSLQKDPKFLEEAEVLGELMEDGTKVGDMQALDALLKGNEVNGEDSADELAPPEMSKPLKPVRSKQRKVEVGDTHNDFQPPTPSSALANTRSLEVDQSQIVNALVQFPPQPPSPQNPVPQQNADALQLRIDDAVAKAVAKILPQVLSPYLRNPPANPLVGFSTASPTLRPAITRGLAPATDPKWCVPPLPPTPSWFPSVPEAPVRTTLPYSTPVMPSIPERKRRRMSEVHVGQGKNKLSRKKVLSTSAQGVRTSGSNTVFRQAEGSDTVVDAPSDGPSSPIRHRQLPTPISQNHSESNETPNSNGDGLEGVRPTAMPMATFSEEDMELLSLTEEGCALESTITDPAMLESSPPPEEVVRPSVGAADRVPRNLESYNRTEFPRVEIRIPKISDRSAPVTVKRTRPISPLPSPLATYKPDVAYKVADSDSEDLLLVPTGGSIQADTTVEDHVATIADSNTSHRSVSEDLHVIPTVETTESDTIVQGSKPMATESVIECDLADELDTPITPYIKCESLSPGPQSLLRAPLATTPRSAPQLSNHNLQSSGNKSTPKLSRYQFAKKMRAQWAKQGRSGTPQKVTHRKSLLEPRTNTRYEDSDDELAW